MADIDSLFAEFGGLVPPSKPEQVAIAAETKRQNLGIGYRAGAEADLGLNDNSQTIDELLNPISPVDAAQQNYGRGQYGLDTARNRTGGEVIGDSVLTTINGILQGGLSIAATGAGIVDDRAGAAVSGFANDVNEFAQGLQSDDLNAERRALGARNEVSTAHNQELYEQDIANGKSSLMSMLKREGRNFLDAMTNQDSATFGDGTFNGVGSLLLGGVLGKGMKALGVTERAAMPLAIGALEGGGAYQSTVNEVMGMSHDALMAGSTEYADLIASGVSADRAKSMIANDAGLMAGLIQAPVGVATGALVSKFEASPFKVPSLGSAAGNILKEGVEEGLQGASGEIASNVGIDTFADHTRELSSGVGAAMGEGALFGLGTAGAVQGPGVPVRAAISTGQAVAGLGKKAWESAKDALNARGERINAEAAEASPVSVSAVNTAVNGVREEVAANPQVFDELELELAARVDDHDEQNAIADHVGRVKAAFVLDPSEAETETNPMVKDAVTGATDRLDAIRKVSQVALNPEYAPEDRLAAGLYVFRAATQYTALFEQMPDALKKDAGDDAVLQKLAGFQDVAAAIRQDSELRQVAQVAAEFAGELTVEQVSTPEQANLAAEAIDAFPEQAKPEVVDRVLMHADALPEDRKARLEATAERLRVQQELVGTAEKLKLDPAKVTEEVMHTENSKNKRPSAFQHMNLVLGALREGNREKAAIYLHEMMEFARHMNGKVAAYNQSYESGTGNEDNRTQYEQLLPDRTWKMTTGKQGVYLNPERLNSVVNAKMVEANAKAVTQLANRLAGMLGDLGTKPIEFVPLHDDLQGNAPEVVTRYRRAKTAAKAASTAAPATAPATAKNTNPEPAQPAREPEPSENAPAETAPAEDAVSAVEPGIEPDTKVEKVEAKVEQVPEKSEEVQTEEPATEVEESSTPPAEMSAETDPYATQEQEAAPKSGIEGAYPGLHQIAGKLKNWFYAVFKTPAKPISRLMGQANSAQVIYDALQSNEAYQQFLGADAVGTLSAETSSAYSFLFGLFNPIQDEMHKRLTQYVGADQARLDNLTEGNELTEKQITAWRAARVMNFVTQREDGSFAYQPELLNGAIMAGLSWIISAQQRQRVQDQEDIAKLLGVSESVVQANPWTLEFFNGGIWAGQAKNDLANKIKQYWGVQADRTAPKGYTDGLAEAMAAEIIAAMQVTEVATIEQSAQRIEGKTYTRVAFHPATKTDKNFIEMRRFPDVLDRMVLVEPELTHHVGSAPAKTDTHQLRNRLVKLKPAQVKMLKRAQNIEHTINDRTLNLFNGWGRDMLKELFGAGTYDAKTANVNYAKSVDSKNSVIDQAMNMLDSLVAETDNVAAAEGKARRDMKIFYRFGVSKVGRLHMQGAANPQANKLAREVILPTRQEVDINDPAKAELFMLAVAQHLGVKIHKMSRAEAIHETNNIIDQIYPLTSEMDGWKAEDVARIKQAFKDAGADLTPGSIHAMQDYARFLEARDTDEGKAFETALYIEADGVTDGPINAMMHMASRGFSAHWLKVMAKGGLYVGPNGRAGMTLNEYHKLDKQDLYKETSLSLDDALNRLRAHFLSDPEDENGLDKANRMDAVLLLLAGTAGASNISFNPETNELEIQRGIVKNPLTVTIYGSGPKGIAGKISGEILTALYEQLSKGTLSADTAQAFQLLTGIDLNTIKDTKFTFGAQTVELLDEQMLSLFVEPMREAIKAQIGETDTSIELLRDAVQVQSIFMVHAFNDAIEQALDRKEKAEKAANSGWRRHDFLSEEELLGVYEQLRHLSPYVDTGTQSFMMMSRKRAALEQKYIFGQGLFGELNQEGFIEGPGYAGVKGIPTMIQGPGDGMMVQNLMLDPEIAEHLLAVFDGVNFGLNDIEGSSERVNRAVRTGWLANPLADVATSFSEFFANVDFSTLTPEMRVQLAHTLFPDVAFKDRGKVSTDNIMWAMEEMEANLQRQSLVIQARHNVLSKVDLSIDHMASVGKPFVQKGSIELKGTSFEEVAVELQLLADAELIRLTEVSERWDRPDFTSEDITSELNILGSVDEASGAKSITLAELQRNLRSLNIPREQKGLLKDVLKALQAVSGPEFQVIFGNREQVMNHRAAHGLAAVELNPNAKNHGFQMPGERLAYLMTGSSETLVHELIHAATLQMLLTYYEGDRASLSQEQRAAIQRIEQLANQWRSSSEMDFSDMTSPEQAKAVRSARKAMDIWLERAKAGDRGAMAFALNEFMAHNLTNMELVRKLQRTPVTRKLAQLAREVVAGIKQMIWGKHAKMDPVGNDLFSNLRFNTQVLIYSAPGVQDVINANAAFHATQEEPGETSDRLTKLRKSFAGMMGRWVRDSAGIAGLDASETIIKGTQAAEPLTSEFSTAFRMTRQEAHTFHTMVLAFMTKAEIDPNALTRMEVLYRHVINKLVVEDFMDDREANEPNDRYRAQEKLNTLLGHHFTGKDEMARSSLMPSFIALAMVNDQFRAILGQMDLPKSAKDESGTLDAWLDNLGSRLMNELDRSLSGEGKQKHIQAALDRLVDRIMQSAVAEQGQIETALEGGSNFINKWNDQLAGMLSEAGHKAFEALDDAKQRAVHDWHKKVLSAAQLLAATFNEEDSAAIQAGIVQTAEVADKIRELSELAWEVVGRTEDNALIFDMIKLVRTAIQQSRQQYREQLPKFLASKFKTAPTESQWAAMFHGMAGTDLAGLFGRFSMVRLMGLLEHPQRIENEIKKLQDQLRRNNPELADKWIDKANELSQWKMHKKLPSNLLRNAHAIANLYGEMPNALRKKKVNPTANDIRVIDQLVSLYNLDNMKPEVRETLSELAKTEGEGLTFLMSYLIGQRNDELSKVDRSVMATINHYKGYTHTENDGGSVLIVANDDEFPRLRQLGFVRVRAYQGSPAVSYGKKRSYYFAPVSSKAPFSQGIIQNVRMTASGVDPKTGLTQSLTAGVIDDPYTVNMIRKAIAKHGNDGPEALMPIYNHEGDVVAYEQSMHWQEMDRLDLNDQMHEVIGVWRGRQIEELKSQEYNSHLVQNLRDMWERDQADGKEDLYVDLFSKEVLKDRVLKDAVKLFTPEFRDMIDGYFPDGRFMVRKSMVNNVTGYRNPSVGDVWTGVSRWSPEVRSQAVNIATAVLGKDAFTKLMKAERVYQTFITDARVTIVVKSVVVPAANILSNIVHLLSLGLSIPEIKDGFIKKAAEVDGYLKGRLERIRLEAELRGAEANRDISKASALKAQIQSITDNDRRLSIWPLIERGEFASISDAGVSHEEIELTEGRLSAYLEKLTEKLPPQMRTMARYGLVSRDTSLFKGLQRAVEYGDFLAKATLYTNLVDKKKQTPAKALGRITEEFIHYDYLPGRTRTGLDNFGLTWFWNYKLRAMKIALATIRNNPLNVLLAGLVPMPEMFGSIGTPVGDNMGVVVADGRIGWSTGIDQALNAHTLNPWFNGLT